MLLSEKQRQRDTMSRQEVAQWVKVKALFFQELGEIVATVTLQWGEKTTRELNGNARAERTEVPGNYLRISLSLSTPPPPKRKETLNSICTREEEV